MTRANRRCAYDSVDRVCCVCQTASDFSLMTRRLFSFQCFASTLSVSVFLPLSLYNVPVSECPCCCCMYTHHNRSLGNSTRLRIQTRACMRRIYIACLCMCLRLFHSLLCCPLHPIQTNFRLFVNQLTILNHHRATTQL